MVDIGVVISLVLNLVIISLLLTGRIASQMQQAVAQQMETLEKGFLRFEDRIKNEMKDLRTESSQAAVTTREEWLGHWDRQTQSLSHQLLSKFDEQRAQISILDQRIQQSLTAMSNSSLERDERLAAETRRHDKIQDEHLSSGLHELREMGKESDLALRQGMQQMSSQLFLNITERHDALAKSYDDFVRHMTDSWYGIAHQQSERFETFAASTRSTLDAHIQTTLYAVREMAEQHRQVLASFGENIVKLNETTEKKLEHMRQTVELKLSHIQQDNSHKLEQMRATVDEKLHATLEKRLGESFQLVSQRLEMVHKGLGEMQTLASGVGDLKKVLTNVKARGTLGEIQLENILEQTLTVDQYQKNAPVRPRSQERVDFAVNLPGPDDNGMPVILPIDAKFPVEDYQRLLQAQDLGDAESVVSAAKSLDNRLRQEAKSIQEKYINPPATTDFGILFLPIEGLFAEVLRRPGLWEDLQRDFHVIVTGPTTITALLNSLQMGFKTLSIQKRSSEVWKLLGAVRTEFGKFGAVLEKTQKKLQEASNTIDEAKTRTRAIEKKLRRVDELPSGDAEKILSNPEWAAE